MKPLISSGDETLFSLAVLTIYLSLPLTLFPLLFIPAPYGKHSRPGWGFSLPSPTAWFLMEIPSLFLPLLLLPHGRFSSHPLPLFILSLFLLHYLHRSLISPLRLHLLRIPSPQNQFPISILALGFLFNLLNAYIQTRSATHYVHYGGGVWVVVRAAVGLGVFGWGMKVNVGADMALVRLKKDGGGGYKIPRGGWFELVSCPNYMGEIVEWMGWAVVSWSPAAFGFFLYTVANLVPRARSHHRWYLEKFGEEYPRSRKAVFPYMF